MHYILILLTTILTACGDSGSSKSSPSNPDSLDVTTPPAANENNAAVEEFDFDQAISVQSKDQSYTFHLIWKTQPQAGPDAGNRAEVFIKSSEKSLELVKLQPKMNCCGTKPPQKQSITPVDEQSHRLNITDIYFHNSGPKGSWSLLVDVKVGEKTERAILVLDEVQ